MTAPRLSRGTGVMSDGTTGETSVKTVWDLPVSFLTTAREVAIIAK